MSFFKIALLACVATLSLGALQASNSNEEKLFSKENELVDCGCKKRKNVDEELLASCSCPHLQQQEQQEELAGCGCTQEKDPSFHHDSENEHVFA